jgi:hypothetical protein
MQGEDRLLLRGLDRDEAHRGAGDGFADRLGIVRIRLVGLHIRPHELWRHEFDRMPTLP